VQQIKFKISIKINQSDEEEEASLMVLTRCDCMNLGQYYISACEREKHMHVNV